MISKRLLQLVLVALSASQVAQASYGAAVDGVVVRAGEELHKRQSPSASGTGSPGNTPRPTTTSAPAPSTTPAPSPTPSQTSRPPPTTTPGPAPSSTTPSPSESSSSESEKPPETSSSEPPKTTSTLPPTTITTIETITNTDGSLTTRTSAVVTTPPPSIIPDPNAQANNNNQGMSAQTRNTIIGVVVGVGGAIILAVAGLFVWRMWGRKKAAAEDDGLMDYGTPGYHPGPAEPKEPSVPGSSTVGSTGRSPFQSTLESYHAPTQVNTASNF